MIQEASKISPNVSTKLSIENSDISDEDCDVIVNTTTENMVLGENALSKALLHKAGPDLQRDCDQRVRDGYKLDYGKIVVTESYGKLKCRKLIHAHVPLRPDAVKSSIDHFTLIHSIVTKCLAEVERRGMKSVSFPAFGFGQGGYSVDEVACPMLTAMQEFGKMCPKSVDTIKVVIHDQALHKQFFDFFLDFFKFDKSSPPYRLMSYIGSAITGRSQNRSVELQDSGTKKPLHSISQYSQAMPTSMLLFDVYAPNEAVCVQIVNQLKQLIKKKSKDEPISNPIIASLFDADCKDIMKVGEDLQVNINIMRGINKIRIQGECMVVVQAKSKILEILNAIEKAQNGLQQFEWNSYGDDDDMEKYSSEDSSMLERAFVNKLPAIELTIDKVEVVIDFNKMKEKSKSSGKVRAVKREKIRHSSKHPPLLSLCIPLQQGY